MIHGIHQPGFSIWLKPIFKRVGDKIIDCTKSKRIDYKEIKAGDIIDIECNDAKDSVQKQVYIATGNCSKDSPSCTFLSLNGKQIKLSEKALMALTLNLVGTF